jgi:hypothetical protein
VLQGPGNAAQSKNRLSFFGASLQDKATLHATCNLRLESESPTGSIVVWPSVTDSVTGHGPGYHYDGICCDW